MPTPPELADKMVEELVGELDQLSESRFLFPGVGAGPFVAALERYCDRTGQDFPSSVAVDTDRKCIEEASERFGHLPIEFQEEDFLSEDLDIGAFDYVVGNPPYVPIQRLNKEEREKFKRQFESAFSRFDLYFLFFERSVQLLRDGGRLAFVTPEKFEYVESARPLRKLLTRYGVDLLHHLEDEEFAGYTAYPCLTVLTKSEVDDDTVVQMKDGSRRSICLPTSGESWASSIRSQAQNVSSSEVFLKDVTERISVGVATGADRIFTGRREDLPLEIEENWAVPTVSGESLERNNGVEASEYVFVCPYDQEGELVEESELGLLAEWLSMTSEREEKLRQRSCVQKQGERWYGWHENPQMEDLLQQKILWRDITDKPKFWIDRTGEVIPRHSVYYLIPEDGVDIEELKSCLNTPEVRDWLFANCQRARNGYIRLQTSVISDLPVPETLA